MSLVGYECDCVDRCSCFDRIGPTPQYTWNPRPYGTPLVHRPTGSGVMRTLCGAQLGEVNSSWTFTDVTCESCRHAAKEER